MRRSVWIPVMMVVCALVASAMASRPGALAAVDAALGRARSAGSGLQVRSRELVSGARAWSGSAVAWLARDVEGAAEGEQVAWPVALDHARARLRVASLRVGLVGLALAALALAFPGSRRRPGHRAFGNRVRSLERRGVPQARIACRSRLARDAVRSLLGGASSVEGLARSERGSRG